MRFTVNWATKWLSRRHEFANIRDGIYRIDFKSGRPEDDGIAVIRNGVLRGLDQKCVYSGVFTPIGGGRIACRVQSERHPMYGRKCIGMQPTSATTKAILKLVGTGTENGFQLFGESEADPRSRYAIRGTLIAEVVGKTICREDAETLDATTGKLSLQGPHRRPIGEDGKIRTAVGINYEDEFPSTRRIKTVLQSSLGHRDPVSESG